MRLAVLLVALLACLGCASYPPPSPLPPASGVETAQRLRASTVGLFMADPDDNGRMRVFCTGVWVSSNEILTAGHCSEAVAFPNEDEDNEGKPVVGTKVFYALADEAGDDPGKPPKAVHEAFVVSHHHTHDLSLLLANNAPSHSYVEVAYESPQAGAKLAFMGQTQGLYWTYCEGVVAAFRKTFTNSLGFTGSILQVSAPIWFGNSGGPAIDAEGNLVGISSFINPRPRNVAFYIPVESIRPFLMCAHGTCHT